MAAVRIRAVHVAGLVATVFTASGCGASSDRPQRHEVQERVVHIHGLDINPTDEALILSTHRGLFRAGKDETELRRLDGRRQDTKGLAITGPDQFIVSGHAAGSRALGLITTRDAGRSWKPVVPAGKADFHVLRTAAGTVYGFDSTSGRLKVSVDAGRTWTNRVPPAPLLDVAVDARDPDRLIASSAQMLFASSDGGRSWRALRMKRPGLLAWPAPNALYLVATDGAVYRSDDAGNSWAETGQSGGRPKAFTAHGSNLYVALQDNTVEVSGDDGRNWSVRTTG
jgi:photosystem II stability/assembly factor-like uncharacterized protein